MWPQNRCPFNCARTVVLHLHCTVDDRKIHEVRGLLEPILKLKTMKPKQDICTINFKSNKRNCPEQFSFCLFSGVGEATKVPVRASPRREFFDRQNWKNFENGAAGDCRRFRTIPFKNGEFIFVHNFLVLCTCMPALIVVLL